MEPRLIVDDDVAGGIRQALKQGNTDDARRDLEKEINVMSMLSHPYLLQLVGVGSIPGSGRGV